MKISVVGGGNMGSNHARVLNDLGALDYVVESNDTTRALSANKYGQDKVATSIDATDSEAYIIATPSSTHFSIAYDLLQKGKHVLIEKPICTDPNDALKLLPFCRNLVVATGMIERFNPAVEQTKLWTANNPIRGVNNYRLSPRPAQIKDVGVIMDLGIHDVDSQLYLVRSKPKYVYATAIYPKDSAHEHYGKIIITYQNGTVGTIEVSWLHTQRVRKMNLVSDQACATVDYLKQMFTEHLTSGSSSFPLVKKESLKSELENFIDAINNKTQPLVTVDQAIEALKVVQAAYMSLKTKNTIVL